MTYSTQAGMVERYGEREIIQLTDRVQADVIDSDVLDGALLRAFDFINLYLSAVAVIPLIYTPPALRIYEEQIARYYLYFEGAPEIVISDYEDAVKWLDGVSSGDIDLDDGMGDNSDSDIVHTDRERVFTDETLIDYSDGVES